MSKTPYEIRLDVLKIAQEMVDKEYQSDFAKYQTILEKADAVHIDDISTKYQPTMYDESDVTRVASQLYSFVSDNSKDAATTASRAQKQQFVKEYRKDKGK